MAAEASTLLASLPHASEHVFYSAASSAERRRCHALAGRITRQKLASIGIQPDASAYICGPSSFMSDMRQALTALGLDPASIRTELFGTLSPVSPGITTPGGKKPHLPPGPPVAGPLVTFARSGISVPFGGSPRSVLELADECDVPVRWSCRTGVCQTCITPLLSGEISYSPDPLDPPSDGRVLICCAWPGTDIVLDL